MANPCCTNTNHVTNFGDPDFLSSIISDLTKLKFQLRKKLQPAVIIDGIELACGAGCGREKVEQTIRAGWALDPVHPTSHVYAKMALNLIENYNPLGDAPAPCQAGEPLVQAATGSTQTGAGASKDPAAGAAAGACPGGGSGRGGEQPDPHHLPNLQHSQHTDVKTEN